MFDFFRRFMYGRYGNDSLNRFIMVISLILAVIWNFIRNFVVGRSISLILILLLAICYFRMLSRDINRRQAENQKFLQFWMPRQKQLAEAWARFQDRKVHRYYKCEKCKTYLRVPRNKGKINIKCPKCGHEFVKKT